MRRPPPASPRTIRGGSGSIPVVMYDSTPAAMLFGLRHLLRVAAGPVLAGGGLTIAAAILLEIVARS